MQQAGYALTDFVAGKTLDDYLKSELLRSAVERKLMIIGEALNQLLRLEPDLEIQIPDAREMRPIQTGGINSAYNTSNMSKCF